MSFFKHAMDFFYLKQKIRKYVYCIYTTQECRLKCFSRFAVFGTNCSAMRANEVEVLNYSKFIVCSTFSLIFRRYYTSK